MKTLVCLCLITQLAAPRAEQVLDGLQADLHHNLACTAATYAALDTDAEADYERAEELCAAR